MAKAVPVPAAALLVLLACCSCCGVRGEVAREVRVSLVNFLTMLAGGDGGQAASRLGWNAAVDPCRAGRNDSLWGNTVTCFDSRSKYDGLVKKIELGGQGLSGTIDAALFCAAPAVRVLDVHDNSLRGGIPAAISACSNLTHLVVGGNQLSGILQPVLAGLKDLQVIDVSRNNLSGELPGELSKLVLLRRFLANDNHFTGRIPDFNLSEEVDKFSVSNNNLTGPIPKNVVGKFRNQRFWLPNADGICGQPVFPRCQSSQSPSPSPPPSSSDSEADKEGQSKSRRETRSARKIAMYIGFALLGAVILALVLYLCLRKRRNNKLERKFKLGGGRRVSDSSKATTTTPTTPRKSVYSLPTSAEQSSAAAAGTPSAPSTSLVVLRRSGTASITTPAAAAAARELRFEDLLKSPAELLGRGRFGSSYKVVVPGGAALVVKRVKDAEVGEDEFRRRMERVGRARHLAVLPPLAFYCAMQEKLVLYEFQSNGSLARLLHGSIESSHGPVDWPTRLHIAAKVADGMAFMHAALRGDGTNTSTPDSNSSSGEEAAAAADGPIAHGSLKTSNILFTNGMEPCISEYGVTAPHLPTTDVSAALQADVRAFGVVLLELLTGKATVAQGDGAELARWVAAVIREEWTAEVFDRALLDGSSEQRMVRLLQVAMRCVDASPGAAAPPTMREVASMINAIREEDDRSLSSEA